MSKKTALYNRHVELGGRMVDFHGWLLPVQYEGIIAEHKHCRTSACLFDTSHMIQILIGVSDPSVLGRLTTQDASDLPVGRARYGFLLNEAGGIMDDTVLMRLTQEEYLLVGNASMAQEDSRWVINNLAGVAELTNQSAFGWGKIDLQGPAAAEILRPLTRIDLSALGYFHVTRGLVCGQDCILSRTGYTGELGYEICALNESIEVVFRRLLANVRVAPAGLGARDSLRLEMCYPLHGQDIGPQVNPIEADLCDFLKGRHHFVGSAALKQIAASGPDRKLIAFVGASRRRASTGDQICHDRKPVGQVTSAAFSPSLDVSIGMGYVPVELGKVGQKLTIRTARAELEATVSSKPIYKQGTCRTKNL